MNECTIRKYKQVTRHNAFIKRCEIKFIQYCKKEFSTEEKYQLIYWFFYCYISFEGTIGH